MKQSQIKNDSKLNCKKYYLPPDLKVIEIDNDISLALESEPVPGPDEARLKLKVNNDFQPYKI